MRIPGVPIVSVTPLGSSAADIGGAIDQIIDYLQRGAARRPEPNASILGYYADAPTAPGVWRGRGVNAEQLSGPVDVDQFRRVLEGAHPHDGTQLVDAVGSSGRTRRGMVDAPLEGPPDTLLDVDRASTWLGVDRSYIKKLALETERNPDARTPLRGTRDEAGHWWFSRAELERFAATRKEPKVVVAFDVTVSFEKSISLVWARATPEQRRTIEAALDAGTNAAVAYLEDQALAVRVGGRAAKADGVWAASYRHMTNRNLEPQLHDHVVIANIAAADGRTQTLHSRLLHHHAKTAGYVAGAVTRRHLTDTLGLAWQPVERGLSDIDGITRPMINAFSTRRAEITTLTDELGLDSAAARNVAALATRAPKTEPADWETLEAQWTAQLDHLGLTSDRWTHLRQHQPAQDRTLTNEDTANVLAWLDSPVGVTRHNAVFGRRDVVQAIIEWDGTHGTGNRLDYDTIDRLADTYLTSPSVVTLAMTTAQVTRTGEVDWYSTTTMLDLERAVISAYTNAHINHSVLPEMVDAARLTWENTNGNRLGADQAEMVDAITSSTQQFLPVVGPAGSGKTAALHVAAQAWTAAGYQPLGVSVTGTATEVLAEATNIPTRTVASLIAELNNGGQPFTDRTVLIVDEASTLSNRDHHALVRAISDAAAIMRTIGDPAQHRAVEAGGLWAHLVTDLADTTPTLTVNRRQASPEMIDVRLANADYRNGLITQALARLADNRRIVTAPSADELLDHLTADWYTDRLHNPAEPSRMMAESHAVRRQLNHRAQTLLAADGTLTGPSVTINGERFHVGDTVITRTQDRDLRHDDGHFLRNAATGTITAIDTDPDGRHQITVDFDRHGPLTLPDEFLTRHIRTGLDGGLAPAYAITTHAAQGSTYRTGRMLTTDTSTREGVYVGLTRGTTDTRLYLVAADELAPGDGRSDVGLPIIHDTRSALDALADHLNAPDQATVIAATDPDARIVHTLRTRTIDELRTVAPGDLNERRALRHIADATARHTVQNPTAGIIERFGERPPADSPLRPAWDDAIAKSVKHSIVFGDDHTTPPAQRSSVGVTASAERLDTLRSAAWPHPQKPIFAVDEVAELASRLRAARSTLPLDDKLIASLSDRLDAHARRAVDSRPDYLTDLLGQRPDDDDRRASRWDKTALTIERTRHRNGVTPERGTFEGNSSKDKALGPIASAEVSIAKRAVDEYSSVDRALRRGRSQ
jgi:conjugative relaxase-like TrwC/TraI family protein